MPSENTKNQTEERFHAETSRNQCLGQCQERSKQAKTVCLGNYVVWFRNKSMNLRL